MWRQGVQMNVDARRALPMVARNLSAVLARW